MDMKDVKEKMAKGISAETARPNVRKEWTKDNMYFGQNDVVALFVQECLGGEIGTCKVNRDIHYVNLIDGKIIDIAGEQLYGAGVKYKNLKFVTTTEILKNKDIRTRFMKLKDNIGYM